MNFAKLYTYIAEEFQHLEQIADYRIQANLEHQAVRYRLARIGLEYEMEGLAHAFQDCNTIEVPFEDWKIRNSRFLSKNAFLLFELEKLANKEYQFYKSLRIQEEEVLLQKEAEALQELWKIRLKLLTQKQSNNQEPNENW